MKVAFINSVCGYGSTGRIVVDLSNELIRRGHETRIFYGQYKSDLSNSYNISSKLNIKHHQLLSRVTGKHGGYSKLATKKLIVQLNEFKPDIIHLHNIHGFYLNIFILFEYLKTQDIKVIWTLHDCWAFTGHCAYFDFVQCNKWKNECYECANKKEYPISYFFDRSRANYHDKLKLFNSEKLNLTIVTPSNWLLKLVNTSFLSEYSSVCIYNGIDTDVFMPYTCGKFDYLKKDGVFNVLFVAANLEERKGVSYIFDLATKLDDRYQIILLGVKEHQIKKVPKQIIAITHTNNKSELAELYSLADVYVNPTLEDNFPTTNLEALACGTPVITFATGGSPEAIDNETGIIIVKKNTEELIQAIKEIDSIGKYKMTNKCRKRAIQNFTKDNFSSQYISLYEV